MKKLFLIGTLALSLGSCMENLEEEAAQEMDKIEAQVAQDSEKQYDMAKKHGNAMDAYVHASAVAEAYLQAGDEANYEKWKEIEKQEAKNAGMEE